jgi:hypothetical protein
LADHQVPRRLRRSWRLSDRVILAGKSSRACLKADTDEIVKDFVQARITAPPIRERATTTA